MALYRTDTIVACATAPGRGAIAIVRWSGPSALAIAERVFVPRTPGPIEPWKMRLGTLVAGQDPVPIDEALGVFFPAPQSFTGEDTFEAHCHGSPVIVEQVIASAISAGARSAERGEFTRRAVLNGKLDLLQAEAVADLVSAKMAAGARAAWRQLQGALSIDLDSLRDALVAVLADIEAQVDFTDDELPDADCGRRVEAITLVLARIEELLGGFAASRRQREGFRVVFTGKPNAGKSSLVNRLLGSGRMIVSDEPGTTRDVVEECVDLGGIAFVLADTAGIREAVGAAEAQAVQRARETLEEADLRILVLDASVDGEIDAVVSRSQNAAAETIVVWNKMDLEGHCGGSGPDARATARRRVTSSGAVVVETSARTGAGCDALADTLVHLARKKLEGEPSGISRVRHRAALERTLEPLRRAGELARSEGRSELAAVELRTALLELSSIAAPLGDEEVLDRIFSEFCIGK